MLVIQAVDHVGTHVSDKAVAISFYSVLGSVLVSDAGFEKGHPVIMRHESGVVLNLLGPATKGAGENILMDGSDKFPGITHVALRVESEAGAREFCEANAIPITGQFRFGAMSAIFIRDPDRNVIELDAYAAGAQDVAKSATPANYEEHP